MLHLLFFLLLVLLTPGNRCDPLVPVGEWSEWTEWSSCSVTCGQGKVTRSRNCLTQDNSSLNKPICKGPKSQSKVCTKYPCEEPVYPSPTTSYVTPPVYPEKSTWSEWSAWSIPARSCGSYPVLSIRQRTCTGKKCEGIAKESRSHKLPPCFVNGNWGEWTQWSESQKTCGYLPDVVYRERTCDNPPPSPGGNKCEGESRDTKDVPHPSCEVDGIWGPWHEWSDPSKTCSEEGQAPAERERMRVCDNPPPSDGGKNCEGDESQVEEVYGSPCPINGQWGEWSDWSESPESCGYGASVSLRTRVCNNPPPKGGLFCEGSSEETREVYLPECETDGEWCDWSDWSTPSKTCGPSSVVRLRECSDPPPSPGGKPCPGPSFQTKKTNGPPCY